MEWKRPDAGCETGQRDGVSRGKTQGRAVELLAEPVNDLHSLPDAISSPAEPGVPGVAQHPVAAYASGPAGRRADLRTPPFTVHSQVRPARHDVINMRSRQW